MKTTFSNFLGVRPVIPVCSTHYKLGGEIRMPMRPRGHKQSSLTASERLSERPEESTLSIASGRLARHGTGGHDTASAAWRSILPSPISISCSAPHVFHFKQHRGIDAGR